MKKSLIALALVGALTAPMVAQADVNLGSVTLQAEHKKPLTTVKGKGKAYGGPTTRDQDCIGNRSRPRYCRT